MFAEVYAAIKISDFVDIYRQYGNIVTFSIPFHDEILKMATVPFNEYNLK